MEIIINQDFIKNRPLSYSSLKEFAESPKHYIQYITKKWERTDAMLMGLIVDCLLFTPDDFDKKYFVTEKPKLNSKVNKEFWQNILDKNSDKIVINTRIYNNAVLLVNELKTYEQSKDLISCIKKTQIKLRWIDKETELDIIGYVDADSDKKCWDLKVTNDTSVKGLEKFIVNRKTYIQIGLYALGYQRMFFKFPEWYIVGIEPAIPFNVNVVHCSNNFVQKGKDEVRHLLRAFRICMEENLWHMSFDFWLMNTRKYYIIDIPRYANLKLKC